MTDKTKKNNSTLYIILGVIVVVALFAASAIYNTASSFKQMNKPWSGPKVFSSMTSKKGPIAILDVEGVIFESRTLIKEIRKIEDEDSFKGILLRINSPGGSVAPTQEILEELMRVAKEKPIFCSFADIAASGGYYLSTVCEKIFTNPGTLTGSIGVIMPFANLEELYKFIKVDPFVIKAGKYKDLGSESRPMTVEERLLLQSMADEIHTQFKDAIKNSRKSMSQDVLEEYTDGRIFLGSQAIDYGFADEAGGEYKALESLAKKLEIEMPDEFPRFPAPEPEYPSFFRLLAQKMTSSSDSKEILKWISDKVPELNSERKLGVAYFLPYNWFTNGVKK